MTANPLMKLRLPDRDPATQLQDHVDGLNRLGWVKASGRPYFVAQRQRADGTTESYVSRNDYGEVA